MNNTSIVIAGVGGQGTLLASRIIGHVALRNGCDVKVSEVHGMSQRGGSVTTYVRYGESPIASPIIDPGHADVVLAFEMLEAYRSVAYLKKDGHMIASTQRIAPMPVITGAAQYPADIEGALRVFHFSLITLDAQKLAIQAGNEKAVNVVLIGRLAATLAFPKTVWLEALRETVKPAFLEMNLRAFELGYACE